jgi:hypothetical protein
VGGPVHPHPVPDGPRVVESAGPPRIVTRPAADAPFVDGAAAAGTVRTMISIAASTSIDRGFDRCRVIVTGRWES